MIKRPFRGGGMIVLLLGLTLTFFLRAQDSGDVQDNDTSPYHQALLSYKTGHYDTALTAINEAEKTKSDDIPIEILKARILVELHQFDQANKVLNGLSDKPSLTPAYHDEQVLALGDLNLRRHSFAQAAKCYESLLATKPNDPDLLLKAIYARIGDSDLITAGKYASQLKPFDPDHPSYYFAQAALARATGKDADQDIETVRTIYGITITNRYLKTYLQVVESTDHPNEALMPPSTNAAPANPHP